MTSRKTLTYEVVESADGWRVFIVHDEEPQWWRLIATFASHERADSYAEIEGGIYEDTEDLRDDEKPPAPEVLALAEPPSRIKPENFRPAPQAEPAAAPVETLPPISDPVEPPAPQQPPPQETAVGPDPDELPEKQLAVLLAVKDLWRRHESIGPAAIAKRSDVPHGSIHFCVGRLIKLNLLTKDRHGLRPYGAEPRAAPAQSTPGPPDQAEEPPAPPSAPKLAFAPPPKPLAHVVIPAPPPQAQTEEERLIAEHIAAKGVTRADGPADPHVDEVMDEVRRHGAIVVPDEAFGLFEIDSRGAIDREALLLRANATRMARGLKKWDLGDIKWERRPAPPSEYEKRQARKAGAAA